MAPLPDRVWFARQLSHLELLNAPFRVLAKKAAGELDEADLLIADGVLLGGNLRPNFPSQHMLTPDCVLPSVMRRERH